MARDWRIRRLRKRSNRRSPTERLVNKISRRWRLILQGIESLDTSDRRLRLLRNENFYGPAGKRVCPFPLSNGIRAPRHLSPHVNRRWKEFSRKTASQVEHQRLSDEQHGL